MVIRRARMEDASAACGALRRSIVECCAADHRGDVGIVDAWLRNKTPENVGKWIAGTESYAVVAESDGNIDGLALLSAEGSVLLCYVVPEALHRSIGKAMLTALEAEARRRGLREMSVSSTRSGHAFYQRNGFVDQQATDSSFGFKSFQMRKVL